MATREEKRASIIAEQADREAAQRAEGKAPALPTPRSNWAASVSPKPSNRRFKKTERPA